MSRDVEHRPSMYESVLAGRMNVRLFGILAFCAGLLLLVPVTVLLLRPAPPRATRARAFDDDTLTQVVNDLSAETDLTTLKNNVQRLNAFYSQHSDKRPRGFSDADRSRLEQALALDADDVAEIDSGTFTVLDAHHLDLCFLLRDAAKALQADVTTAAAEDPEVRLTPLQQATATFDWVVRQVRLEQSSALPIPPQFILRRGQGTALERSLIFIDLLRQLNVENEQAMPMSACLLVDPGTGAAQERLWAVGVVIGKDVYLFDPRLGLPLPGPDGKGVATLAEVLKDPRVLDQLTIDKFPYDVKREQARDSEVFLYVSLSAVTPRMANLQKEVLAPRIRVNLATDVFAEEAVVRTAVEAAGMTAPKVRPNPQAVRLLRSFLPAEEGGADRAAFKMVLGDLPGFAGPGNNAPLGMFRKRYFELDIVPWTGFPDLFRGFPYNAGLGSFMREQYALPFRRSTLEPKAARDLILRGQYTQAIHDLMDERDNYGDKYRQWQHAIQEAGGEGLFSRSVQLWLVERAVPAAANMERARREGPEAADAAARDVMKVWTSGTEANLLLSGSIAAQRRPEVTFLLAQAKQERAEQLQLRVDAVARRHGTAPGKDDTTRVQAAWRSAEEWWRHYADEYPAGPGAAVLRRPRGRCQMMLGDWQAAIATWEDVTEPPIPPRLLNRIPLPAPEKAGNLLLAAQLRKQHPADGKP